MCGDEELSLARLHALLLARRFDHQFYCARVPHFSDALIARYSRCRPAGFARVLVVLGEHTTGELPYERSDELARFYAAVFRLAAHASQQRLALTLLSSLGASQRRYPVADVVRSVLWSARSRRDVRVVLTVLEESPSAGWYVHPHTFRGPLDPRVALALARAGRASR